MPASPAQQALIDRITARLRAEPRVEAAWLAGSLGRGQGDAWSDIDVLALTQDGAWAEVSEKIAADLSGVAAAVLINPLYGGRLLNVVTENWERFDFSFIDGADLGRYDGALLKPLFNRGERTPPTRGPRPYSPAPKSVRPLVEEFLRVIGLSVVAVGRRETLLQLQGVGLLRGLTMDLMLEANGVSPAVRGGVLHRRNLLTPEQYAALEACPPLVASSESAMTASLYLAGLFLPLARELAQGIGMVWPDAFEAATRRRLRSDLGVVLP